MRLLNLDVKDSTDFEGKRADMHDYDEILTDEFEARDSVTGKLIAKVLKNRVSQKAKDLFLGGVEGESFMTNNRTMATGEGSKKRNKQVISAVQVQSGMVGFFERTARMPFCRACAWNLNNPEKWNMVVPLIAEADQIYREFAPREYQQQKKEADKCSKDFLVPGSIFSTVTINKNFRTAYHRDAGNLPDGTSAMVVLKQGNWFGAELVLPNYRVAIRLSDKDVILFNPHLLHGNLPIVKSKESDLRVSVVCYFREKMIGCKSAAEELEIVKSRKQGNPLFVKTRKK